MLVRLMELDPARSTTDGDGAVVGNVKRCRSRGYGFLEMATVYIYIFGKA